MIPLAVRLHSLINISVKLSSFTSPVNLPCVCVCECTTTVTLSSCQEMDVSQITFFIFTSCAGHYERFLIPWTGRSMGKFQSKIGEMLYYNCLKRCFSARSWYRVWLCIIFPFLSLSGQHRNVDRAPKVNTRMLDKPNTYLKKRNKKKKCFTTRACACACVTVCFLVSAGGSLASNALSCQKEPEQIHIHKTKLTEVKFIHYFMYFIIYFQIFLSEITHVQINSEGTHLKRSYDAYFGCLLHSNRLVLIDCQPQTGDLLMLFI